MALDPRRALLIATLAVTVIAPWEGLWTTAKIDRIGTGQPVTACYGMTRAEKPDLRVGDKFTPEQCMEYLVKAIPHYRKPLEKCVKVEITNHQWAALTSASYNAGPGAVCKSPMVKHFNAGNPRAACEAFKTWYIRARGVVVKGLINRRAAESKFCYTKD